MCALRRTHTGYAHIDRYRHWRRQHAACIFFGNANEYADRHADADRHAHTIIYQWAGRRHSNPHTKPDTDYGCDMDATATYSYVSAAPNLTAANA